MVRAGLKYGKWLGYLIYTVLLTTGLLYYRLPLDTIQAYLASKAAGADPPMVLSLKAIQPGFPPGVDLIDVGISLRETPQRHLLQAGRISIVPAALSFLSGAPRYDVDAHAYNGDIEGYVSFERHEMDSPFTTSLRLKGIHIGLHPYLGPLVGRDVSGVLDGAIHYAGQQNRFVDGVGQGAIVLSDGSVKLLQPIMGLDSLNFDRLSMEMALKDRKLALNRVQLDGPTIKGELSGTITLNTDISSSRLDLKGTMEPLGGLLGIMKGDAAALTFLRQGLKKLSRSFVIQGTFRKPVFRFM
jgi:type II secretion system protein N